MICMIAPIPKIALAHTFYPFWAANINFVLFPHFYE